MKTGTYSNMVSKECVSSEMNPVNMYQTQVRRAQNAKSYISAVVTGERE